MLMCSRLQVYLGLLTDVAYTAAARMTPYAAGFYMKIPCVKYLFLPIHLVWKALLMCQMHFVLA